MIIFEKYCENLHADYLKILKKYKYEVKKGTTIICKKNLECRMPSGVTFTKGKRYNIDEVRIFNAADDFYVVICGVIFYIFGSESNYYYNFKKYFYTTKESRKIKLKKINKFKLYEKIFHVKTI